jgi:bacterial/archaeal transporter family-2 protein
LTLRFRLLDRFAGPLGQEPDTAGAERAAWEERIMSQLLGVAGVTLLALCAGISFVLQQAVNADLRSALGSAAWAGFISYLGGTICMLVVALTMRDSPPSSSLIARTNWWAWSGGFFGAIYITISILLVPRLGAATFVALLVAGQMLSSVALDQYGLLGLTQHPAQPSRLLGAALLIIGVFLIRR